MEVEQEEMSSMISTTTSPIYNHHHRHHHRHRPSSSSSRYKGVVPQENGHWGAQIYANHQRVWLGTFKTEAEAAAAYDSAAVKLRSGDSYRNFPWTAVTVHEPTFQSQHSTETILRMIKDGSYKTKFAEFLSLQQPPLSTLPSARVQGGQGMLCRELFRKELTPSDVGKLNRLVIPKKYAVMFFPVLDQESNTIRNEVTNAEESLGLNVQAGDTQLLFYDRMMRSWKFRYCYWRSSQSFVFTRGWNRFVKEKGLKARDVVVFYMCEGREDGKEMHKFCMIDVGEIKNRNETEEEVDTVGVEEKIRKGFRLFGVQIN